MPKRSPFSFFPTPFSFFGRQEEERLTLPQADCGLSTSSALSFTAPPPSSSLSALPQTQFAHAFLLVAQLSAAASCSQSQEGQEWVGWGEVAATGGSHTKTCVCTDMCADSPPMMVGREQNGSIDLGGGMRGTTHMTRKETATDAGTTR